MATGLCLRRQQKIHLTKCFSQSSITTSNKKKIMKFPPLAQMGSYHYLMSEKTFLPTAIFKNFGQFSAPLLTGTYKQPVEMSTLKNSLENKKKSNIVFFCMRYRCQSPLRIVFKNKEYFFPAFLVTPFLLLKCNEKKLLFFQNISKFFLHCH